MLYIQEGFSTTIELFQLLKDTFLLSGWNLISEATSPSVIRLNSNPPSANISYIKFSEGFYLGKEALILRGDLDGTDTSLSASYYAQYSAGNNNQLYLSLDDDSFGLFIYSPGMTAFGASAGAGLYGGFLDRHAVFSDDNDAWGVGYIHSLPWAREVAKSAFNATTWQQVNNCPESSSNATANHICPYANIYHLPQQFISIRHVCFNGYVDSFVQYGDYNSQGFQNTSPAFMAIYGGLNDIDGQPVIEPMFLIEGANTTGYGNDGTGKNKGLFFRGRIKHCYTGGASLPVGAEVTGRNNSRYISTGNEGWQLLRIQ